MLQEDNKEIENKRTKTLYQIDNAYNELFNTNESMKLYEKTIDDLKKAVNTEKAYLVTLNEEVDQLRKLLLEEKELKEQYRGLDLLQRKKINALGDKHMQGTHQLERGLTLMNDTINNTINKGIISVQQLERNTKNMVARQASQFYMSKYE